MSNQEEIQKIFENIYRHITTFSCGQVVYGNPQLCQALAQSLSQMHITLNARQPSDINISIAIGIGLDLFDSGLKKFKKHDERRLCFECALVMLYALRPDNNIFLNQDTATLLAVYPDWNLGTRTVQNSTEEKTLMFLVFWVKSVKLLNNRFSSFSFKNFCKLCSGFNLRALTLMAQCEFTRGNCMVVSLSDW
jgi:hypothetical protein